MPKRKTLSEQPVPNKPSADIKNKIARENYHHKRLQIKGKNKLARRLTRKNAEKDGLELVCIALSLI